MKHILILGTLWTAQTVAQRYTYTTQTITECFSSTQADFGPAAPTQGPDKYWTVEMPECHDCNCPDCAYTNTYTTTLDVFSPKGLAKYPYEIKEIYRGMSTMPADATPTSMPYGFTSAVETCNICGDEPIVATMTYPRGGNPYQENVPVATGVVETKFERPSTLRTKVVGEEPTATPSGDDQDDDDEKTQLENTLVHHKAIAIDGADPDDFSDFAESTDFGIGDGTIYDDEEEEDDQDSTPTIEKLNNFHELEEPAAAPSKEKDNAAGSIQPPAKAALALLLPLAFII